MQIVPGDMLRQSWQILKDNAVTLFAAAFVVFAVNAVAELVFQGWLAIFAAAVSIVVATFYAGMVVRLVDDVRDGRRDHSLATLFRSVSPVAGSLLLVSFLSTVGIAIGFVLLLVPGLILCTIWFVVVPVVVLERPGVVASFGRSRELVRGNGWQVFGLLVITLALILASVLVLALLAWPLGTVGEVLLSWVSAALVSPFVSIVSVVVYFTLRDATPPAPPTLAL